MKQTSITKLSEVYNNLKNLYDGKQIAHDYKSLANLIQDVIRAEAITKPKGSKFDIYNYVCKDDFRPMMCGVYHEDGWRIASDAHVLFAEKFEYPEEFEGKSLLKDGHFIEQGKYPKWRSVIPDGKEYVPYEFDVQKFYDWLEEKRAAWKTEYGKGIKFGYYWRVCIGPALLKAELFDKLVTAMTQICATQLFVKDPRSAVYAKTDKGVVLLMPTIQSNTDDSNVVTLA